MELSRVVSKASKQPIPPRAPIIGENVFKHKGGTHIAAIVRNPAAYEILPPESVGQKRRIIFGKYSGKNAVKLLFSVLGLENDDERVRTTLSRMKEEGEFKDLEIDLENPQNYFLKRNISRKNVGDNIA